MLSTVSDIVGGGGGGGGYCVLEHVATGLGALPVVWFFSAVPWCGFLWAVMQALAGDVGLTVGLIRGVSPTDVLLSTSKSRQMRQVATAATSTRLGPLKFQVGDLAAAGVTFVSPMGGAAVDLFHQSWSWGSFCYFQVFQGSFCKVGMAVLFMEASCTVLLY